MKNIIKKGIILVTILAVLIVVWNNRVSAAPVEIDSYSETNQDYVLTLSSIGNKFVGQSFTNANVMVLESAKFYLSKQSSPTGNATAKIYTESHSTAYGTDSIPGTLLATSDTFSVSTLNSSLQLITFTFSGANRITLNENTKYVIEINYSAGFQISAGYDGSSPTHSGNANYSTNGTTWTPNSSYDLVFYVYGSEPVVSSCAYSGTGDWNVKQSDNCYISTNFYVAGVCNFMNDAIGVFGISSNGSLSCEGGINGQAGFKIQGAAGAKIYAR